MAFRPQLFRSRLKSGKGAFIRLRPRQRRGSAELLETRTLLSAVFSVTTTADSGAGSLRQAILDSNALPGADSVVFDIPGLGPHTIQPTSNLPAITDAVTIDGYTQNGASPNSLQYSNNAVLMIELDGSQFPSAFGSGLSILGEGTTVRGLVINNWGSQGISINGANNALEGNYIGTDVTGTVARPNGSLNGLSNSGPGVHVFANSNRIGTDGDGVDDLTERNIISGNAGCGVILNGGDHNWVAGNFLGVDATGNTLLANHFVGSIAILSSTGPAQFNLIGTNGDGISDAAERNVIAGGGTNAVALLFNGTDSNTIAGNYIGTNSTGTAALPSLTEIALLSLFSSSGPKGNVIGTNGTGDVFDANEGNIISGAQTAGVEIAGPGTNSNIVAGNFIGTDASGTVALPNALGIRIGHTAAFNRVGTNGDGVNDADEMNVISGNVRAIQLSSNSNVVAGNRIGTDASGSVALTNSQDGVLVEGQFNIIGGSSATTGNVISCNSLAGITLEGAHNWVAGNLIGTDATGMVSVPNVRWGVLVHGEHNTIGTNGDGIGDVLERNVIAGQSDVNAGLAAGVDMIGTGANYNVVAGNYVGTNILGTAALGTSNFDPQTGVQVSGGGKINRIGTNADGIADDDERNIISGHHAGGISIFGTGTDHNTVAGNYIGTDATGLAAIPNLSHGVTISFGAAFNTVGTNGDGLNDASEGNVISGNNMNVQIGVASQNVVAGNVIGLDVLGLSPIGNNSTGILISSFSGANRIGTNSDGISDRLEGNLIAGHSGDGILIDGANIIQNLVAGNSIGSNGGNGIQITNGAKGTQVLRNTISLNGQAGVRVFGGNTTGNRISENSISDNGALGIDLANVGVTANDLGDVDVGANIRQNFPVIATAQAGPSTTVTGTVNSTPNTTLILEFFASAAADPSGFGEGARFLGSAIVTTDAAGNASFSVVFTAATTTTEVISGTATAPDGSTSEFSKSVDLNSAPTATPQTVAVTEDGSVLITLHGSDVETAEADLVFTITSLPTTGVLTDTSGTPIVVGQTFPGSPTLKFTSGAGCTQTSTGFQFVVTDEAGVTSGPETVALNITPAVANASVTLDSFGIVRVGGTSGNDDIVVTTASGKLKVTLNSVVISNTIPMSSVTEVRVWGWSGSDSIDVSGLSLSTVLFGGDDNDTLTGGAGSDLMFGGDGDDELTGAAGNDFLIGGSGADRLVGSAGNDILVAGGVGCEYSIESLRGILSLWVSGVIDDENDSTLDDTVVDESAQDKLTGSSGADWFIISQGDKVTDFKDQKNNGDLVTIV